MRITLPPVDPANIDSFINDDLLMRREFGEQLQNLVLNVKEPLVVSLEAPWGEGKTYFAHQWMKLLDEESSVKCIYFDAFKSDYHDEAFMTLLSLIYSYGKEELDEDFGSKESKLKGLKSAALSVFKSIPGSAARAGLKLIPLGDVLTEFGVDVSQQLLSKTSETLDDWMEKQFEAHSQADSHIKQFQNALDVLVKDVYGTTVEEKPLVIVIDELDRCRPDFALQLLEKIKHVFSTKSVVFVLINNPKQLQGSVRAAYGSEIDAHSYLQKFYTIAISLPKRPPLNLRQSYDLHHYMLYVFDKLEIRNEKINLLATCTAGLLSLHNKSLRDVEKVSGYLALYALGKEFNNLSARDIYVVSLLCVTRTIKPELFYRIYADDEVREEVKEFVGFNREEHFDKNLEDMSQFIYWLFVRNRSSVTAKELGVYQKQEGERAKGTLPRDKKSYVQRLIVPLHLMT
uniref:KAP family P-loop NTPase fold protein n=1 Tax=Marinobacterium profundum TaxID=1714300 RepID=UPI000834A8F4|nr:P-loop NTPase fold protein [Marinobacterium profundum]